MPGGLTGMWGELSYFGGNGGTGTLDFTTLFRILLNPVFFAKFYPALTLLMLGVGAWTFFRQLKFSQLAATLGALAAMLNSTFFSTSCWGIAAQPIALSMIFFALALVVTNTPQTPVLVRWCRLALAGLCVGMNVMEAADVGALLSMLAAAFVFFWTLTEEGAPLQKAARGAGRVAVVAVFAGAIAIQTVTALVGTQIQGVAGTGQDTQSKIEKWDWATEWSLPKVETLTLVVPGLFGYKMNTPKDMMPFLQDAYQNGAYWGGVGRTPEIDRYFAAGSQGSQPMGIMRFTGGGNYCGILVLLVAAWALAQSLRRKNSVFALRDRRMIWFLGLVAVACLLFSWGRFAPFYYFLYQLPYFSTIRNPSKFIIFFGVVLVMIFAYGVDALSRRYLAASPGTGKVPGPVEQIKNWLVKSSPFDRGWMVASIGLVIASLAAWHEYLARKPEMLVFLGKVGFPDTDPTQPTSGSALLAFSYGEVAWAVVLFAIAVVLVLLVISGCFAGRRAKWGGILLVSFLIFDMGRANLPWINHWNYKEKYEVGSLNPILQFLEKDTYENRVACLQFPLPEPTLGAFLNLYNIEWAQHHFPYYNIQSFDIVQQSRMPEDMLAYKTALAATDPATLPRLAREWQLTSTRYLLGPAVFEAPLNEQLDPMQHRFHILQRFDVLPKPGVSVTKPVDLPLKDVGAYNLVPLEQLTAVPTNNGDYALFEFTGALPRAKVYGNWLVNTNDATNLSTLGDLRFDPLKAVLVSTPGSGLPPAGSGGEAGSVKYQSYESKHIVLAAKTTVPAVLLLNDKYDPNWQVTVDGKPVELLRCNYVMRGVYLPSPGEHTVVFDFSLPHRPLYVTLAALVLGLCLGGFLLVSRKRDATPVA